MDNYDAQKHLAPWIKKKLNVQAVRVGRGIENIGSCAFAGCRVLTEVIFDDNVCNKIGWGAFMDCERLVNISLPKQLKSIGTIAFANCRSLTSVKVPDQCHVQDQAFLNCSSVRSIEVSPTATLGRYVFASEIRVDGAACPFKSTRATATPTASPKTPSNAIARAATLTPSPTTTTSPPR